MRESWTDERLDDLNAKVDRGFEQIGAEMREMRAESRAEFVALRAESREEFAALRHDMKSGFDRVNERFDGMYRLTIQIGGAMLAALLGLLVTQL